MSKQEKGPAGQESYTVIVRADKEVRALASKTLEIQDACNYRLRCDR